MTTRLTLREVLTDLGIVHVDLLFDPNDALDIQLEIECVQRNCVTWKHGPVTRVEMRPPGPHQRWLVTLTSEVRDAS